MSSLEVNNNLFDFPLVEEDIDVFTPLDHRVMSTQSMHCLC